MIHVLATIELQPGCRERFLAEFHQIIPAVRQEAGCVEYGSTVDLATDIAAQQAVRPDTVVVVEKWSSIEALKAHLIAPHMVAYRPKVRDFVSATRLQILEPTSH